MSAISNDQGPCHVVIHAAVLHDMDDEGKAALMITREFEVNQADLDSLMQDLLKDPRIIQICK